MDVKELKTQSEKQLHDTLAEKRAELRELKFQASENQLKNVSKIKKAKKAIAQILTVLNANKAQ